MTTPSIPVCRPDALGGEFEGERWPRALRLLEFPKLLTALASRAASEPGRAACLRLTPATDPADARDRLALMADVLALTSEIRLVLPDFPDIAPVFPKLEAVVPNLDLDDLFAVRLVLDAAREACGTILEAAVGSRGLSGQERFGRLASLTRAATIPEKSASALKRCLTAEGALRDEASPELYSVRQSIRAIHQRCAKRAKDFVQAESVAPFLQDDFLTISADRYVLPVKTDFKGRVQGIVHDYSQTGETVYVEPYFLVDVNNQLQELRREEREEERKVVAFLAELLRSEIDQVRGLFSFLIRLDGLLAAADLSADYGGALVEIAPGLPLTLRAARHPLLALESAETRVTPPVTPVDLLLREGERGLIVSGGNAGGKTVCLKTLGLVALMAQSGLPVPVQEGGTLPFFREFFVFIGDEQSLEAHLSTFTGQIDYLARVWERVGRDSLAILDEFGAGTDPAQGAALAEAVIDSLLERGATVAAATHFPALKVWGMTREGVRAASVIFDPASKRPLYALAYDQVGASLALEAARDHGLPAEILQKAEAILRVGGGETSAVLDRLNRLAAEREEELATMRREANALKGERKSLKDRFEKERQRITDEVRGLSGEIMAKWRTDKLGRKEAQKKLTDLREKVRVFDPAAGIPGVAASAALEAPRETLPCWSDFVSGARMQYAPWSKLATVLGVDEKRGQVKLDLGGVALWVKPEELRFPGGSVVKPAKTETAKGGATAAAVSSGASADLPGFRLDVRGLRADEAGREVERALDKALLRGLANLEIVHGKGTGALRREIHEFLRTSPAVAGFQLATEEFGGDGVTVVELR